MKTKTILQRTFFAGVLTLIAVAQSALGAENVSEADAVYKNSFIYTADAIRLQAQAFAVRDGKFLKIGSNDDMKPLTGKDTRVVDLEGEMVMPGIVDTHIHALRGALTSLGLAFPVTSTVDDIKAAVKKFIADKKLKKGDWVEGAKWDLDYKKLTAKMLDEVSPDNPVFLHDWTNHLGWVNSAALKAAKIDKSTPEPEAGVIDRDSSGNPTGTLHDKALGFIVAAMPPPAPDVVEKRAEWIFNKLNSYGITAIVTPQLDPVRHFLNAVEATRRANGKGPRHHMAHSMLIYPSEVKRFNFEKSNFITEISPYQLWTPDPAIRGWPNIIGHDRFDLTMTPLKTIIDAGAVVTYGSDWDNIPEPDPWFAMEGMITRQYPGHPEYGQLNPDERIDIHTAIQVFTRNGVMAMEKEDETGTIEPGKSADFIVINQNILQVPV